MTTMLYRESIGQPWRDVQIMCAIGCGEFLVKETDEESPDVFAVALSDLFRPATQRLEA